MTSKIQEQINLEYAKFEKKVAPLRRKKKELELNRLFKILSKHKGTIYKRSYGKNYTVLKILKSLTKKGRLRYTTIVIENQEDYSINYIKERNTVSKAEAIKRIKEALEGEDGK